MTWYNNSAKVPDDKKFIDIMTHFIIECPSCIKKGKNKKKTYIPVSNRNEITFRSKGIEDKKLTILLNVVKKPLQHNKTYLHLENEDNVEKKANEIMETSSLEDPYFDLIVFKKRNDMSIIEAIYYYIRNSFAHGSFEVKQIKGKGKNVYFMESKNNGDVKAQMRLKEETLTNLINIMQNPNEYINSARNSKPNK